MTDLTCPCGQPAHNSRLCATCTARLTNIFPTITELWRQLEIRMGKETGVDYRGRGGSRSSEPPAVINDRTTDLRTTVRATILNAAAELAQHLPATAPILALRDTTPYRCIVLQQYGSHLARSDKAPRLLRALDQNVRDLTHAIDAPPPTIYVGTCTGVGAIGSDGTPTDTADHCGGELRIPEEGRHHLTSVACPTCGTTYSLAERIAWVRDQYTDQWVTPSDGAILLGIPRNTINQWARRGKMLAVLDEKGRKTYLVETLMELARARRNTDAA